MKRSLILPALLLSASVVRPATFTVNSLTDAVDASPGNGVCATAGSVCTLRASIQEANALAGVDTVHLPPGTYVLTRAGDGEDNGATGDLDIDENLILTGTGSALTIVDGNGLDRVFENYAPLTVMSGLMVRNGAVNAEGGGIRIHGSTSLTLSDVTVSNNDVADKKGGGLKLSSGTLTLTNVTLSGNSAKEGGAVFNQSGTVLMTNVTIADNTASSKGAGIVPGSGSFTVKNTIVAGNLGADDCDDAVGPGSNNLDGDGSCGFGSTADPLLGPLQDNGGRSFTHALLTGSPAIDSGTNAGCPATDQRGYARPVDGDGNLVATCDIGAHEFGAAAPQPLAIVKRAFQRDGTPIATGTTVPKGAFLKFLLYVNNPGGLVQDVSIEDVLDPTFGYQAGTTKVDNSLATCAAATCTTAEEAGIFAAADGQAGSTDAVDADVASYAAGSTTIHVGNQNQPNARLDVTANQVWAVVFEVRIQ